MFAKKNKTVADILSVFTKAMDELKTLKSTKSEEVNTLTQDRNDITKKIVSCEDEIQRADKALAKMQEITGVTKG